MIRKIMVILSALMLTLVFSAGDAFARPSSSSGSRSSGTSSSGTRSSSSSGTRTTTRTQTTTRSTTATTARTTATTVRSTQAPATTVRTTAGRTTRAPGGTGTKAVKSTVRNTTPVNKGPMKISPGTTASGRSYRDAGTGYTYRYNRNNYDSYYNRYRGGYMGWYPAYGTPMYWTLWNDPFYYPNYITVGSPWYGHPTPVGYTVTDGKLIYTKKDGFPWGKFLLALVLLALVAGAVGYYVYSRRKARDESPYSL